MFLAVVAVVASAREATLMLEICLSTDCVSNCTALYFKQSATNQCLTSSSHGTSSWSVMFANAFVYNVSSNGSVFASVGTNSPLAGCSRNSSPTMAFKQGSCYHVQNVPGTSVLSAKLTVVEYSPQALVTTFFYGPGSCDPESSTQYSVASVDSQCSYDGNPTVLGSVILEENAHANSVSGSVCSGTLSCNGWVCMQNRSFPINTCISTPSKLPSKLSFRITRGKMSPFSPDLDMEAILCGDQCTDICELMRFSSKKKEECQILNSNTSLSNPMVIGNNITAMVCHLSTSCDGNRCEQGNIQLDQCTGGLLVRKRPQ